MYITFLVIFLLISVSLILMILLQPSKGSDIGRSYSLSTSTSLFGSSGPNNFLTKMTTLFTTLFFVISLVLGNLTTNTSVKNKWENIGKSVTDSTPKNFNNSVSPIHGIPN
ncbi:Protein-export membrane protein SecG [Candidatus Arsenophonus lipoptenae]|uniref:Protein-export membrane protein SecG n=1 Tax=Candidatus Arsenophonus lipoptenae TaxID=634113 RepID=A0A109Q9U4_9GAMM|nr:preprotein translocase subunit SecG [Candidatus Arsenophonus lipoptenae]AMA65176.1 Protein-export membrane protein SecG [Candidatus Arsenophonus lipoptenae]